MKRLLLLILLTSCTQPQVAHHAYRVEDPVTVTNTVWVTNTVVVTNILFVQKLYTNGIIAVGSPALPPLKPQPIPAHFPPQ